MEKQYHSTFLFLHRNSLVNLIEWKTFNTIIKIIYTETRTRSALSSDASSLCLTLLSRAPLLWVTFRDQLLSPLVQGAVWGLVGVSIAQFRSYYIASRQLNQDIKSQRSGVGSSSSSSSRKGLAGMLGLSGSRR